jgi:hypothetical protein
MDIYKPSANDLQPLLDQAISGQTVDNWVDIYLKNLKILLSKNPLRYRTYGPYWWLLKKAMVDHDIYTFGTSIDKEWLDRLDYGNEAINIISAHAYEDARVDMGMNVLDSSHLLEDLDGEPYEYLSDDSEMEIKAVI